MSRDFEERWDDWETVLHAIETLESEPYDETDPGPWTARICRYLNNLEENERSVIHCGLCRDYANPRKRARSKVREQNHLLPGFDRGSYILHDPCRRFSLSTLQSILRTLEDKTLVYSWQDRIPDTRQPKGYDYATIWHFP